MTTLRVLTLNIWNRSGPWSDRLALIRAGIERLAPDVIGLQEVVVDRAGDQAKEIADGLGFSWVFGEASRYADGGLFGNAVMSKYKIRDHENHVLPSPGTSGRAAILAHVETPAGLLPVCSTHWSWKFNEGWIREQQARSLGLFLEGTHEKALQTTPSVLPTVLVGDFNTRPDATEIRFLQGLHALDGASVHYADAFEVAGIGTPHTFDPRNNPHAGLTHEIPRRIDYVFVAGPDDHGRGKPISARVVLDEVRQRKDERYAPSDHYGVLAEISF